MDTEIRGKTLSRLLSRFVSVELVVNDSIREARKMLQGAKYQLLDRRVMQRVCEVLSEQLQNIEKAVGVNMVLWGMWIRGRKGTLDFSELGVMGVNSYSMGRVKHEFELAAKDCINFVKSGEYNKHSGEFYQTPLHTVCLRICLWMHPRYGEKNMTEQNVTRLFEPVAGYLSLLSELNILKRILMVSTNFLR